MTQGIPVRNYITIANERARPSCILLKGRARYKVERTERAHRVRRHYFSRVGLPSATSTRRPLPTVHTTFTKVPKYLTIVLKNEA